MSNTTDHYFKKNLDFWHEDVSLTFRVSQSLFSSHQIDTGTLRLLKTMDALSMKENAKVLDIGCGYGAIGLTVAKRYPDSQVHMVDRDALAVDYTRQNATLNALDNCTVYGSLGYDDVVEHDFDLIISNIPGKAGESVITALLEDARYYLKQDGMVAIVVVAPLEELVLSILDQPGIERLYHSVFKGYVVFHYKFVSAPLDRLEKTSLEQGIYHRATRTVFVGDSDIEMETAYGMPEFDSLDYQTNLFIKILETLAPPSAKRVIVYNPGQGYLPTTLWRLFEPGYVILASRDLLSLRYAARNLRVNGCPNEHILMVHQTGWGLQEINDELPAGFDLDSGADCIVAVLREDEGPEVSANAVKQMITHIQINGTLYVAGGSTPITRLLKSLAPDKRLLLKKRRKHKGKSVAIFQRRS